MNPNFQGSVWPPLLACVATVPLVKLGVAGSGIMTVAGILAFQVMTAATRMTRDEPGHNPTRVKDSRMYNKGLPIVRQSRYHGGPWDRVVCGNRERQSSRASPAGFP